MDRNEIMFDQLDLELTFKNCEDSQVASNTVQDPLDIGKKYKNYVLSLNSELCTFQSN